ncbi:MAG: ImmA/IrrE family metallo-endopeptidase [Tyzzerella sp.]|nr:ImmA/IrrE family metallo-endopeptidase [Tyzzerella sp.]
MNVFERLEDEACKDGIEIIHRKFNSDRIKGLYCQGTIALNNNIETSKERACILAEELGHYHTSIGNIINLSDVPNRKQERQARIWAYNNQIGLKGLVRAYEHGCKNKHEIAEFLEVTEEFLEDAVKCYCEKYGVYTTIDNYLVYFIPQLIIYKKME